jgi:hypothetical protein
MSCIEQRDYDEAVEALRRAFCALQRYSFHTDGKGGVARVADRYGRWVEFDAAHELFDPVMVDAALAKLQATKSSPLRLLGWAHEHDATLRRDAAPTGRRLGQARASRPGRVCAARRPATWSSGKWNCSTR